MPRPNSKIEKPKNFSQAIKRLIKNLSSYKVILNISLLLALFSAILALVTPNKLSSLTDEITKGLQPNTKILESISNHLKTGISEYEINGVTISVDDQLKFVSLMKTEDQNEMLKNFDKLPKSIYNLVKPKIDMKRIKVLSIVLISLLLLSSLFSYIQGYAMATVSNNFAKNLRSRISIKINKLPLKYFDNHETGDILSRITNDIDTIAQSLNISLSSLVTNITLFIGSIVMMFITNWVMAITAILSSLIGFIFMFKILSKSQKYFIKKQKSLGDLNGYIEEIYSGHKIVKAYNGSNQAKKEFDRLNRSLYESNRKSQFLSGLMPPMMMFIGNFGYVAVCVVGALLTMNNVISFGVIVAFMIYVRMFTNPMSQIAQAMTNMQSSAAASERVFAFLDEKEMSSQKDINEKLSTSEVKGNIEFKHVKFGYDENKTIIKDFSVTAKSGNKIAIVGPTGAGKTTMVNLLMKFYEINSGDILIDGVSINNLTRENIH